MSTRDCVDELHRDAQLRSRLPQAALHDIARTEFLADGPDVPRFARIFRGRAPGNHSQVREARQASHDFLGQPLCQSRKICVGAAVLERQHGDPEALVGARLSGVCA